MDTKQLPRQLQSVQVMVRFGFRLAIMIGFAVFAGAGFGKGLVTLLWMSAVICAFAGIARREMPFAANLNQWDEMTDYVARGRMETGLGQCH